MNDRPDRDAKLLTGAFHDDWASGPTAEFARAAAAHARRRRVLRRTLAVTTTAAALIAVFVALQTRPAAPSDPIAVARIATAPKPAYEVISDDELIARVRDLPLLVVSQPDGTKQISVLAPPPAVDDPTRSE